MIDTLIIAPHMDDESLSCGVLIQKRLKAGGRVTVLALSGRVYSYGEESEGDSYSKEHADYLKAASILDGGSTGLLDCKASNLLEGEPYKLGFYPVLKEVESMLCCSQPDEVIIPSRYDLNQDHKHYADICAIALRPANLGSVKRIMSMVAFDSTAREHSYYLPFNKEELDVKLAAVSAYQRESRVLPHPRAPGNIEAFHRVMGSKVGSVYAEPYDLILMKE